MTAAIYGHGNQWARAAAELRAQPARDVEWEAFPASAVAQSGDRPATDETMRRLLPRRRAETATAFSVASVYAGLKGDTPAFAWRDSAVDDHSLLVR